MKPEIFLKVGVNNVKYNPPPQMVGTKNLEYVQAYSSKAEISKIAKVKGFLNSLQIPEIMKKLKKKSNLK